MSAERVLGATADLVRGLALGGLASAGASVREELVGLASDLQTQGLSVGAFRSRALGEALADNPTAAGRALFALVTWHRLVSQGVSKASLRSRLGGTADGVPGEKLEQRSSAVVHVHRVHLRGRRVELEGVDLNDGARVAVTDLVHDLCDDDPFDSPINSALFQARVRLRDVVERQVRLECFPVEHRGRLRHFQPALSVRATLGDPVGGFAVPTLRGVVHQEGGIAKLDGAFVRPEGPRSRVVLGRLLIRTDGRPVEVDVCTVPGPEGPRFGHLTHGATTWWGTSDPRGWPLTTSARAGCALPSEILSCSEEVRRARWATLWTPTAIWPSPSELRALATTETGQLPADRLRVFVLAALATDSADHALALAREQGQEAEWFC